MTEAQETFHALAEPLRRVVRALHGTGQHDSKPCLGSPAHIQDQDQTMRGAWGDRPAHDANIHAHQLCIAASDHLMAMAELLESDEVGAFSLYTVARGVLEASARAWYLIDPDANTSERVRRYMNEELWAINESRRFLDGLGADTELLDDRERAIRNSTTDDLIKTKNGWQLGEERPSAMRLSDQILGSPSSRPGFGAATYRFMSATAHSGIHGLARGFEVHGTTATAAKTSRSVARHLLWPVQAYLDMGDRFLRHYGWDEAQWDAERDGVRQVWALHAC